MVSEPILTVSRARTSQLRRIRQCTRQERGYIRMMRGSSVRDMIWYICCQLNVMHVYASTRRMNMAKRGCS
jgi:hypothetical protein